MSDFFDAKENASARGFILRSLVRANNFCMSVSGLSKTMLTKGITTSRDISKHLYYLQGYGLIEFTDTEATAWNALERDADVRLSINGIRFIENGGDDEGIEL